MIFLFTKKDQRERKIWCVLFHLPYWVLDPYLSTKVIKDSNNYTSNVEMSKYKWRFSKAIINQELIVKDTQGPKYLNNISEILVNLSSVAFFTAFKIQLLNVSGWLSFVSLLTQRIKSCHHCNFCP